MASAETRRLVPRISSFLQEELRRRVMHEVTAEDAMQWLDAANILNFHPKIPARPLRELLREGLISGAEQRPKKSFGRWFICRIESATAMSPPQPGSAKLASTTKPLTPSEPSSPAPETALKAAPAMLSDRLEVLNGLLTTIRQRWPNARAFISPGSPFDCDVALVGNNPGSSTPFCPFWNSSAGVFDRERWFGAFKTAHVEWTRKTGRMNINGFCDALAPLRTLELNAYCVPSDEVADLGSADRDGTVLAELLRVLQPKFVVAHGAPACKELGTQFGTVVMAGSETTITIGRHVTPVVAAPRHFARGWSVAGLVFFAHTIRGRLLSTGAKVAGLDL